MLRERHGNWHYCFQVKGKVYTGSTNLRAIDSNVLEALQYAFWAREEIDPTLRSPHRRQIVEDELKYAMKRDAASQVPKVTREVRRILKKIRQGKHTPWTHNYDGSFRTTTHSGVA